jgi:SNF2 family DNA or RNA helicase
MSIKLKLDALRWNGKEMVPSGWVKEPRGYMAIIDGSVDKRARQKISERWNEDKDLKVFLGSPAAFEGINLQGGLKKEDTAHVILLNLPWLPKDVVQAIGRAWRFGQNGQVMVMIPSLRNTIDSEMADVLKEKQEAFDQAVDGGDQNMAALFTINNHSSVLNLIG